MTRSPGSPCGSADLSPARTVGPNEGPTAPRFLNCSTKKSAISVSVLPSTVMLYNSLSASSVILTASFNFSKSSSSLTPRSLFTVFEISLISVSSYFSIRRL